MKGNKIMPSYNIKVVGQLVKSFRVEEAEDEIDARNIAESEFLDEYAVTISDGSGIAWDLVESTQSEETL
jgi:hypothetical protein